MLQRLLTVFFVLMVAFMATGCGEDKSPQILKVGDEVKVPDGFELLGVAQYGQYASNTTTYCRQENTNRFFVCDDGKMGRELIVPSGYTLVDVSAYGKWAGNYTFYCQNLSNKKYYVCDPG